MKYCFKSTLRGIHRQLVIVSILGAAIVASAQSPRVFYIGHSLSDQIPDMVASLSLDHPNVTFSWVYQGIPGAPLRWQWDRKNAMDYNPIPPHYYGFYDAANGLAAGGFDALVLTESVPRYPEIIEETYAYSDSFYRFAVTHNPGIRVYLYEDWHCLLSGTPTGCAYDVNSSQWRQRLTDDLAMWESVVDTLNNRFKPDVAVCLIPGGQGLAALYDSIQAGVVPGVSQISELFSDDIHLNEIGKYFMACIHFATIHGTSPEGLTSQLQVWWGGDFTPPSVPLAMKFQQIAWSVATNYSGSCIGTNTSRVDVALDSDEIVLFPNPTEGIFEIGGKLSDYTIQILDHMGVACRNYESTGQKIQVYIQDLPGGLYFIRIQNKLNNQICIQKIIKLP